MQICPKCDYERKPSDDCPDWQCPSCGVAYCKARKLTLPQNHTISVKTKGWKILSTIALLVSVTIIAVHYWESRSLKKSQPVSAPLAMEAKTSTTAAALSKDPIQIMVEGKIPAFEKNGYMLTALASFELEAKVLSSQNYWLGREADLSPTDLALGWGSMATEELLSKVKISQSNRWFYWRVEHDFTPEMGHEISTHASNMHIIPASAAVEQALNSVKEGQIVYIKGYLMQANAKDGWTWRSSLSREDIGEGACELLWANDLRVK